MSDELIIEVNNATLLVEIGAIPVSVGGGSVGPDLTAIEALTGTGYPERTADDTWVLRPALQVQRLSADVSESAGTLSDTGLAFTPAANKTYIVEAYLLGDAGLTSTGFQWCFTAPGGATYSAMDIASPNTINAKVFRHAQLGVVVAGTSMASLPSLMRGSAIVVMGASPSGQLKVQFQSEVPGASITLRAGSALTWLEV